MNILIPVVITVPFLALGYAVYARYIAKLFRSDDANATPAHALRDEVDYVPTRMGVLFGHHFASIAGGGPIIGPTLALIYGFTPVWLWILLGAVFVGAVHDMVALFTSVREKGRSIAEVAARSLGRPAAAIFLAFALIMLFMLTAVFLKLTVTSLTSLLPLTALDIQRGSLGLSTIVEGGVEKIFIGGIASTSVIIITCCAPLIGYLLYRRNVSVAVMSIVCLTLGVVSVAIGLRYPIRLSPQLWMVLLSVYTMLAAGIPVWLILQPRDFTNVFLLYGGMGLLLIATVVGGAKGILLSAPSMNLAAGAAKLGPVFPLLFITVACGAISGFHALVAGGTSSKQVARESDVRPIAYGGMVLEGLLALLVLIAVASGVDFAHYSEAVFPASGKSGNPILGFAMGMGGLLQKGLGIDPVIGTVFGILMVEGFVVTTLDTAVRLNRYLLEELWALLFRTVPRILKSYVVNSAVCVALMYVLAQTNTVTELWKMFGSANQLLAALALIAGSAWLAVRSRRAWVAAVPAAFMMVVTTAALVWVLVRNYLPARNWVLAGADVTLLALALGVLVLCVRFIRRPRAAGAASGG